MKAVIEMNVEMIQGLISNFSVLATCIFILIQISNKRLVIAKHDIKTKLLRGFSFGLVAIILMYFGIHVSPAVFIDLRSIAIVCASIMGGFYASIITSLMISLGRIFLFGGFTTAAVISSISAVTTGIVCGIIASFVKEYKKKWIYSLVFASILPSIVNFLLLGIKSLSITPFFLAIFLPCGVFTAYFIYYLDKLKLLFLKYEAEVAKDYLTGLFNYRSFDMEYNRKLQQADHKQNAFSVLLVDIDYFKKINDTYGHKVGDEVLKQFATVLVDSTGSFDTVFRIGGEEFAVLLEDYPHHSALLVAEKICKNVREYEFSSLDTSNIQVTASVGIASFPGIAKENLFEYADNALYKAKKEGRNKVVSCL
jgi:diguanylate cyclase